jgi:hypothetical protein
MRQKKTLNKTPVLWSGALLSTGPVARGLSLPLSYEAGGILPQNPGHETGNLPVILTGPRTLHKSKATLDLLCAMSPSQNKK